MRLAVTFAAGETFAAAEGSAMIKPTVGLLRPPRRNDMMSANMVLSFYEVIAAFGGTNLRDELFAQAGLRHLPGPEEPVREKQVYVLHQLVRDTFGNQAPNVMRTAGEAAADVVARYRIPDRAKTLMARMPWPMATWLLMRSARQHAWTFGGSGQFQMITTSTFELTDNPAIRGTQADHPICDFHAALFGNLMRSIVHRNMSCMELSCSATGAGSCTFKLATTAPTG